MPTTSTLKTFLQFAAVAVTFVVCAGGALAQAQRPPYGPAASLETAKKIGVLALAEARKNN